MSDITVDRFGCITWTGHRIFAAPPKKNNLSAKDYSARRQESLEKGEYNHALWIFLRRLENSLWYQ